MNEGFMLESDRGLCYASLGKTGFVEKRLLAHPG